MKEDFLTKVFELLSNNIGFPYYQAERRIDIFINFFLEDIVRQHTKFTDAKFVAVEFPLKKNKETDHAAHIDYLMFSKRYSKVLLVELKTDDSSFDSAQINFYLVHDSFKEWYTRFENIKMLKNKNQKDFLIAAIEKVLGKDGGHKDFTADVIVLKPTFKDHDYINLENHRSRIHFIPLTEINIQTQFQNKWDLLKREVLSKLRSK